KLTWNLSVGVPIGDITVLTWNSSKIPAGIALTLDGIDMKLQDSMELGEGSHSFGIGAAPSVLGDVNHDGMLSAADAVLALQMASGSIDVDPAADVSSDGMVASLDVLMILQAAAGNTEIG
ncbi:MAG: hypothetical protein U9N61_12340, partial [Euryarchaeota archaeon]|nr:hypothetical protein [Euryarchaeota archaeon]